MENHYIVLFHSLDTSKVAWPYAIAPPEGRRRNKPDLPEICMRNVQAGLKPPKDRYICHANSYNTLFDAL
jgi:hypothetical protein